MNNKQREIFMDIRHRVMTSGRSYGKAQYYNALKEAAERRGETPAQAPKADDVPEMVVDECKEMTKEDFEKIKEHPGLDCHTEFIKTPESDWFFREVTKKAIDKP